MDIALLLATLAVFTYFTSAVLLLRQAVRQIYGKAVPSRHHARILAIIAALLHTGVLYLTIGTPSGLNLGIFNVASLTGWMVTLLWLLASLKQPVENLGILLLPLVALAVVFKNLLFPNHALIIEADWRLETHILGSMLAYSVLSIAAVQALLLAIQERQLRLRRLGGVLHALPPLQTMENLLFRLISLGFILLSMSLLSGILFLEDIFAQHLVHKTVLSLIAWVVFAVLLWGRRRFGWRGRTAIRWTLAGFATLMLAYFGSKLVLELLLHPAARP